MLSHSAVLRLWRLELTLQSLSPVLARYDPVGVDVPLNFDTTHSTSGDYITDCKLDSVVLAGVC